ncbi:DedA family protein [Streptomyces sp. NPDC056632]|uniref:DedA family protein n=1 Tax=Streptomyces sp. NPDC056632 TaxID=3345884 RepID=UPI0036816D6F
MNTLTATLGQVPAPAAYALLATAVLAESLLVVGAFVPTLTLLVTAGVLARAGALDLTLVIATAASAAALGDVLAWGVGRLLGSRLRTGSLGRRMPATAWNKAESLMARRGGQAVFFSRFVPVVRTLTPHLAGATRVPYRRIAPPSLLAASLWAGTEAATGYFATASVQHVITVGGPVLAVGAACVTAVVLAGTRRRRRSRRPCRTCPHPVRGRYRPALAPAPFRDRETPVRPWC